MNVTYLPLSKFHQVQFDEAIKIMFVQMFFNPISNSCFDGTTILKFANFHFINSIRLVEANRYSYQTEKYGGERGCL